MDQITTAGGRPVLDAPDPCCPQCGDPTGHVFRASPRRESVIVTLRCATCLTEWDETLRSVTLAWDRPRTSH